MPQCKRPLPLGESQRMVVGDTVYVVGNPQGLEGTFSDGIISGIRHIGSTTLFQIGVFCPKRRKGIFQVLH